MPDPRHGVFETLLVIDGRPVELDAHLARLSISVTELFPDLPTPDLSEIEAPVERGSLRIVVVPVGDTLEVQTSARAVEERGSKPVALHSLAVPGGLGAHKWADRSLLETAQAGLPAQALPLIVDSDGTVLEASRANVFAVQDGDLLTPPADGRILPGITRMRVLEIAEATGLPAHEAELTHDDLLAADEVFLTGSVHGVERVHSLDGTAITPSGDIALDLRRELLRAWTAAKVG